MPFTPLLSQGSDAYEYKEVDDIVYELDAAMIIIKEGDVDIGGNPSAEEQAEALEGGAEQVINLVHSFRLQQTSFDKKGYLGHLKVSRLRLEEDLQNERKRVQKTDESLHIPTLHHNRPT